MESWRHVWREGFAKVLSDKAVLALHYMAKTDDSRLIQGATTSPPPLMCVQDWPCEAGCLIAVGGWMGESVTTVGEVELYFARMCYDADQVLGEPAACRWLLNWFDDTPRGQLLPELTLEMELEINRRKHVLNASDTDAFERTRAEVHGRIAAGRRPAEPAHREAALRL